MEPRVVDGFLVIPTSDTLRKIRQPAQRAELIRLALDALREHEANTLRLRGDTALDMRRLGSKWVAIGRRFGVCTQQAFKIATERRAALDGQNKRPNDETDAVAVPEAHLRRRNGSRRDRLL